MHFNGVDIVMLSGEQYLSPSKLSSAICSGGWSAQRRSLELCLGGRKERGVVPSIFHFILQPPQAQQRPSYILSLLPVITPTLHSVLAIHKSLILRILSERAFDFTNAPTTFTALLLPNNQESPPPRSSNFTTSVSVVTTSSRIAAASAGALPARAAHLLGWTHRLHPPALSVLAPALASHASHPQVRDTALYHIMHPHDY
jgi:hypothetical protein